LDVSLAATLLNEDGSKKIVIPAQAGIQRR
jgi:hypothetical protein